MSKRHVVTATIYDKSGNVLSCQQNNYSKSHPLQARFAALVGQPERIYLHAEIAALIRLKKNDRPYRIAIERYHRNGSAANARPCEICEAALKQWGIKRVEYTL
jgi:tRNA(Arg) A34 adenosine deaminase TadA